MFVLIDKFFILNKPISIYKGLAFEQVLLLEQTKLIEKKASRNTTDFSKTNNTKCTVFIWRSLPAIVLGRNQNPLVECNLKYLRQKSIDLARRDSGGGTVFQDSYNLNFCVISVNEDRIQRNLQTITDTLKTLGIECTIDNKNNIRLGENKISGSAYRYSKNIQLHHFTLLLSSNLDLLHNSLTPSKKLSIISKGIASCRTTVTNLGLEVSTVLSAFLQTCNVSKNKIEYINEQDIEKYNRVVFNKELLRLQDSKWIYRRCPEFNIEINYDSVIYLLSIVHGNLISILEKETKQVFWKGKMDFFSNLFRENSTNDKNDIIKNILKQII